MISLVPLHEEVVRVLAAIGAGPDVLGARLGMLAQREDHLHVLRLAGDGHLVRGTRLDADRVQDRDAADVLACIIDIDVRGERAELVRTGWRVNREGQSPIAQRGIVRGELFGTATSNEGEQDESAHSHSVVLWARPRKTARNSSTSQLDLPFDSALLDAAEFGSIGVVRYRGQIAIVIKGRDGNIDSIEANDAMLSSLLDAFARAA